VVVSFRNLDPELQNVLKQRYPTGWGDDVIKVPRNESEVFYAVILETEDTNYLVKVDVKVDGRPKDDDDILAVIPDTSADAAVDPIITDDEAVDAIVSVADDEAEEVVAES
jgi:hypothetical protein